MTESLHLVIYSLTLAGGKFFWCSRKQNSVALLSMEAEYITASEAAKEGMWLREFLASLEVVESASQPVTIFWITWRRSRSPKIPNFIVKVNTLWEDVIIFVV